MNNLNKFLSDHFSVEVDGVKVIKLPTLSELILKHYKEIGDFFKLGVISLDYSDLLRKDLQLGQFIACKDGKPLEEPDEYNDFLTIDHSSIEYGRENWKYKLCQQYQTAKEAVIFYGWELNFNDIYCVSIDTEQHLLEFKHNSGNIVLLTGNPTKRVVVKTISDLIPFGLYMKIS